MATSVWEDHWDHFPCHQMRLGGVHLRTFLVLKSLCICVIWVVLFSHQEKQRGKMTWEEVGGEKARCASVSLDFVWNTAIFLKTDFGSFFSRHPFSSFCFSLNGYLGLSAPKGLKIGSWIGKWEESETLQHFVALGSATLPNNILFICI